MAQPTGTAADNRPLLELSTLDKVEHINIDGEPHDLVNLDALPIRERGRVGEAFTGCMELLVKDGMAGTEPGAKPLTRKQERDLSARVRALLPLLIPTITPATVKGLNEAQRQEIVLAFFVVRAESASRSSAIERMSVVVDQMMSSRSIGGNSSRASNGSSVAARASGTRRSRRA